MSQGQTLRLESSDGAVLELAAAPDTATLLTITEADGNRAVYSITDSEMQMIRGLFKGSIG